jgi:3-hydroxymyristoyl/3-hydroxydecanoyl-(acyl carrier protein) dehydratase
MLLVDRVTGIDAVPRSMGTGTIWTETDVRLDSWYLDPTGRMPPGLMVEAGQADLLLISWLGVDLVNRGERVYRLLGCELTFHGSPAEIGDTLRFEISIDGHGEYGSVRLFFFHYDCYLGDTLLMSVRNGQAGFFTESDLAATGGVLWDPTAEEPPAASFGGEGTVTAARVAGTRRRFDSNAVRAFAEGRPGDCFGPDWAPTKAHVRSPRIGAGRLLLIDEVTEFDPAGGPWRRGYLRAQTPITADDWFFAGHFLGDPCMPGTLMLEGCLQAMSFYLAALGHTIDRDGWRFEPVPEAHYSMHCRGQVIPDSERLVYEVFVVEVGGGPQPTLIADVLVSVDGVKAFHVRRAGLRLVPDWPLEHWRKLGPHTEQVSGHRLAGRELGGLVGYRERGEVAVVNGFAFDYPALLAGAWGKPSTAFGPQYQVFDGPRRAARLPGPPYHFMSRVTGIGGEQGGMAAGAWVEVEYDVPEKVWYFEQSGQPSMPYCVLMEVALQPCGWLASYVGCASSTTTDLLFRNLDGTAVLTGEVTPATRTIRTRATLTELATNADTIIVAFTVNCSIDGEQVFSVRTVFGFFPATAFEDQAGLPASAQDRALLTQPSESTVNLPTSLARYGTGHLRLPDEMLLMLDRITGYWPSGGAAGLGRLRAEKDIGPEEWFFSAHFFQDPVQPGSLGVQAMCQLLQFALIEQGTSLPRPRFEPIMLGEEVSWKYRGQVVPSHDRVVIELEILTKGADQAGEYATASAALWVDGTRIYQAQLGMRVVPGELSASTAESTAERTIDPEADSWLGDHRPTWTVPAMPMMAIADELAAAVSTATGLSVRAVRDMTIRRWVIVGQPVRLRTEITPSGADWQATLLVWREASTPRLSRFEPVASARVQVTSADTPRPAVFEPSLDNETIEDPYASGRLFHGPAYQYLTDWRLGPHGAAGTLDVARGRVPVRTVHPGLLDAATHIIPHDELWRWSPTIPSGAIGYPTCLRSLEIYQPLPDDAGRITVLARFAGFDSDDARRPTFDLQLCADGLVLVAMRLVDVLLPTGPLGAASRADRQTFLRDRRPANGLGLSTTDNGETRVDAADVEACDWLPGTVADLYRLSPGARGRDHLATIAAKDHVARLTGIHPADVDIDIGPELTVATVPGDPLQHHRLSVRPSADAVSVYSVGFATDD